MAASCEISVIISTFNRADLLSGAVGAILNQHPCGVDFEIILVNNNSTDHTEAVAQTFATRHPDLVKYVFEPKQGLSYGRNAGIANARGRILVFTDDDVRAASDWIIKLRDAFLAYPDAAFIGGPVIPIWTTAPPHWADVRLGSFALQEYGEDPRTVDSAWPRILIGANLACRREVIDRVGLFDPATQRIKDGIGSLEDREWEMRVFAAGDHGKYVPGVRVLAPIPQDRLSKAYHRRWHLGHGRFRSMLRIPAFEASSYRILDTPGHVYRDMVKLLLFFAAERVRCNSEKAFRLQCDILERLGFIAGRWRRSLGAWLGK